MSATRIAANWPHASRTRPDERRRTFVEALDLYMRGRPEHRGQLPGSGTTVEVDGEAVRLGTWLHNIRYQGLRDPDGAVYDALRRHGFSTLTVGGKIRLSSETAPVPRKPPATNSHRFLEALERYIADGAGDAGVIPPADAVFTLSGKNIGLGRWIRRVRDEGTSDPDGHVGRRLESLGFPTESSAGTVRLAWNTPMSGTARRAFPVRLYLAALDAYMDGDAERTGGVLPPTSAQQWVEGHHVPLGKWMHSVKRRGLRDRGGTVAAALRRHGFLVRLTEDGKVTMAPGVAMTGGTPARNTVADLVTALDAFMEAGPGEPGRLPPW
ncbi:hypothetical protein OKJ48_10925, partial [Streptomyces kunmingensis]